MGFRVWGLRLKVKGLAPKHTLNTIHHMRDVRSMTASYGLYMGLMILESFDSNHKPKMHKAFTYLGLARNEGMDSHSIPYITLYSSFHFRSHSFIPI